MEYENFKEKVELTITYEEYQKLRKTCSYQFWKTFLIASLIIILFFSIALIPPDPLPIEEVVISDIFVIMVMFFLLKIRYVLFSKLDYKRFAKNKNQVEYKIYFYDKYIKLENEKMNLKINYEEIKKIKITSTDIYIIVNTKNIIPIPKHKINMNLIDYLYDRIPKTKIKKKIAIEEQQENLEKYEKVKIGLIVLFVLTIISIWASMLLILLTAQKENAPLPLTFNYTYVAYYLLPIPVLSIILGIIYRIKGLKCTKNIIAGIIVTGIILLEGSVSFLINDEIDYKNITTYRDAIGITLPSQGKYYKINWDESYLLNHKSNYIIFTNPKEEKAFFEELQNSKNWLTKKEISTNIENLLTPATCESVNQECYYSIYIKELNTHNTLPVQNGVYHIYAMTYSKDKSYLDIEEYIYNYKE